MSTQLPVAAPRTGARPKMMNGSVKSVKMESRTPPPPPTRRKKKVSAPVPPMNSTMAGSTTSLLTVKEDISMIRPQSVMSNASLSSNATVRSHKKRRAPPPPVRIITVNDNHDDNNVVKHPSDKVTVDHDPVVVVDTELDEEQNLYSTVNKVAKDEDSSTIVIDHTTKDDNKYEVGESVINLSDEDGDHIYEKIEVVNNDTNNNDNDKEEEIPVFQSDTFQEQSAPPEKSVEKEKKEKKKKKKDKLKEKSEKPPKKKKKGVDVKQTIIDDKLDGEIVIDTAAVQETEIPSFRGAKATNVSKINEVEEPIQETKPDPEPIEEFYNPEVESDVLVNSDDELVDLFTKRPTRKGQNKSAKSVSRNANPAKHGTQHDINLMDDLESDDGSDVDNLEDSQDVELADKNKNLPKKLSGKELEEIEKEKIRKSMKQTEDAEHLETKSEAALIHGLKNIYSGDGVTAPEPAYKREPRAVELDINSDEDFMPSLNSSRASSVINLVEEKEDFNLDHQAIREMKGLNTHVNRVVDNEENTENDDDNHVQYTTVHDAVIIDNEKQEKIQHKYESKPPGNVNTDIENSNLTNSHGGAGIHNDLIEKRNKKRGMPGADSARIHVDVTEITEGLENVSVADSIKSPSPDSGIHDFNDSCSSPVSVTHDSDQSVVSGTRDVSSSGSILTVYQETSIIGLDSVDVRHHHADNFNHEFAVKTHDNDEEEDVRLEPADLPKTHNLNKVLFSMSSYNDRKSGPVVEQSSDLFRTPSYNQLADKLNSSLAKRQDQLNAVVEPRETKPQVPARNFDKKSVLTGYPGPGARQDTRHANYANMTHQGSGATAAQPRHGPNPISRELDSGTSRDYEPVQYRSKIIEQFQAKNGPVILGRSYSSSLDRNPEKMSNVVGYSSLGRGGGGSAYFPRTRRSQEENHYDSPRSLLGSGQFQEEHYQHQYQGGPPSISVGVWGDKPRFDQVRVREEPDEDWENPTTNEPGGKRFNDNIGTEKHSRHHQLSPPRASGGEQFGAGAMTFNYRDEKNISNYGRKYSAPPQLSQHQHPKQIEIRYKNGQAAEVIDDPSKAVLKGSRTSRGDFNNGFRINEARNNDILRSEIPSRPKLRSVSTTHHQADIEPVIIPKVGFIQTLID